MVRLQAALAGRCEARSIALLQDHLDQDGRRRDPAGVVGRSTGEPAEKVHRVLHKARITPLIQNRSLWKDERQRMLPGHDGRSNIVYDEAGTVYCYDMASRPLVRRQMAYIGHEPRRKTLKYRCPACRDAMGHRARCVLVPSRRRYSGKWPVEPPNFPPLVVLALGIVGERTPVPLSTPSIQLSPLLHRQPPPFLTLHSAPQPPPHPDSRPQRNRLTGT